MLTIEHILKCSSDEWLLILLILNINYFHINFNSFILDTIVRLGCIITLNSRCFQKAMDNLHYSGHLSHFRSSDVSLGEELWDRGPHREIHI